MSQLHSILRLFAASLFIVGWQSSGVAATNPVDDPSNDGWATEVTQSQVAAKWKTLATLFRNESIDSADVSPWVSEKFHGTLMRPNNLTRVFDDRSVSVYRVGNDDKQEKTQSGVGGFVSACRSLQMIGRQDLRHQFKIFRIIETDNRIETHQHVMFAGRKGTERREMHAVWIASWEVAVEEKKRLKLLELEVPN